MNGWVKQNSLCYPLASFFFFWSEFVLLFVACCIIHSLFLVLRVLPLASCFTTFTRSPLGLVQNSSLIFLSSFTICIIIIHHHLCCCCRRCCCYCYFYYDHYYFVSNLIYWSCRILRAFSLVFLVMRLQGMHYVFYVIMPKPDLFISQVVRSV